MNGFHDDTVNVSAHNGYLSKLRLMLLPMEPKFVLLVELYPQCTVCNSTNCSSSSFDKGDGDVYIQCINTNKSSVQETLDFCAKKRTLELAQNSF